MRSIIDDSYNQWSADPSKENMGILMTNLTPILRKEAHRYKGPTTLLTAKAKQLAVKAVKTFDPTVGVKLSTHIVNQLQPLTRYGREIGRPVHVPESSYLMNAELRRHTAELQDELLAEPTDEQIADKMRISVKKIQKIREANSSTAYDASVESASDNNNTTSSVIDDGTAGRLSYATDVVYNSLNEQDKKIMSLKTGRETSPIDNASIAKKLSVSPAYVSQRSKYISDSIGEVFRGS